MPLTSKFASVVPDAVILVTASSRGEARLTARLLTIAFEENGCTGIETLAEEMVKDAEQEGRVLGCVVNYHPHFF